MNCFVIFMSGYCYNVIHMRGVLCYIIIYDSGSALNRVPLLVFSLKPLQLERQRLTKEWEQEQEAKMQLMMRVAFVFYEGQGSTNHYEVYLMARLKLFFGSDSLAQVHIARGSTVGQFLDRARMEIQKDFKELRNAPVESLLCVAKLVWT